MRYAQLINDEQSVYEYDKAPETIGKYLKEIDISGKTVMDFGCGGEPEWLAAKGAKRVIGIDVNEEAIEQARSYTGKIAHFTIPNCHPSPHYYVIHPVLRAAAIKKLNATYRNDEPYGFST